MWLINHNMDSLLSDKTRIYHVNHNPSRGLYFNSLHDCSLFIKRAMCIFACHIWCCQIFVDPQMYKKHIRNKCSLGNAAVFGFCLSFYGWKLLFIFLTTNVIEKNECSGGCFHPLSWEQCTSWVTSLEWMLMSLGFLLPRTLGFMSGQMSHPLSFHQTEKRSISRGLLFFF